MNQNEERLGFFGQAFASIGSVPGILAGVHYVAQSMDMYNNQAKLAMGMVGIVGGAIFGYLSGAVVGTVIDGSIAGIESIAANSRYQQRNNSRL